MATILSMMLMPVSLAYSCTNSQRFCSGGNFATEETYTDVYGNTEQYWMAFEMYEGSIPLTQMAMVWKEISTLASTQIARTANGSQTTQEVVRLRRIW